MNDANLEVVNLYDLRLRKALDLVAVTFHDVRLTFCGSQILEPLHRLQNASELAEVLYTKPFTIMLTSREPTLPGQITCCILPGMSRSLNYSGREAAR